MDSVDGYQIEQEDEEIEEKEMNGEEGEDEGKGEDNAVPVSPLVDVDQQCASQHSLSISVARHPLRSSLKKKRRSLSFTNHLRKTSNI